MNRLLTAAAFAALIAGPALAQTTTTTTQTSTTAAGDQTAMDPAADTPPADATTTMSTTGGSMTTMRGDVQVVSNAPIPDTAENRARYGLPESRAGKARIGEGPVQSLSRSGSR